MGFVHVLQWNKEEVCEFIHEQQYDPEVGQAVQLFPLSNKCNAEYDLMPPYVNPGIVALTVLVVLSLYFYRRAVARERADSAE